MAFDYQGNLEAVRQALIDYNDPASTPYLSQSLSSAVVNDNIKILDPEVVPWKNSRLPAIFIRLNKKEEDFEGVGATGIGSSRVAKRAHLTYEIIGLYPKGSKQDDMEDLLNETYTFAGNIESVFRQEYQLSSTALWCTTQDTEFVTPTQLDGMWVKAFVVTLKAEYLFK